MVPESVYALSSALLVSLISFVGVLTLFVNAERVKKFVHLLVGLAVGTLFGDAFLHILPEAFENGTNSTIIGSLVMAGILGFFVLEKVLHWHHSHTIDDNEHPRPIGYINLSADLVHNFLDGILIGVSYLAGVSVGVATTIAIVLHEIPQEIGDFGILLHAGFSRGRALFFNFLTALLAVLGTGVALAVGTAAANFVPFVLPIAAGGFLYIAGSDLVPELHKEKTVLRSITQFLSIVFGFFVMTLLK